MRTIVFTPFSRTTKEYTLLRVQRRLVHAVLSSNRLGVTPVCETQCRTFSLAPGFGGQAPPEGFHITSPLKVGRDFPKIKLPIMTQVGFFFIRLTDGVMNRAGAAPAFAKDKKRIPAKERNMQSEELKVISDDE